MNFLDWIPSLRFLFQKSTLLHSNTKVFKQAGAQLCQLFPSQLGMQSKIMQASDQFQ